METNTGTPGQETSAALSFVRRFPPELWMVIAALLVRIVILCWPGLVVFDERRDDLSFVNEMSQIAGSLFKGQGFSAPFFSGTGPTAWVPPLYPWFCSLIYKLVGGYGTVAVICILLMNSVFSALTCVPLVRLGERIFDRRVALISGWAWAFVPYFAKWALTWIWDTPFSTLLLAWLLYAALQLREHDTNKAWIGFGLLWGVAMLTNPAVLTVLALCFLWLLRERGFRIWKHIALGCVVCFLVISPWLVRNRIVMHKWIFIRSNFGFELRLGNFEGGGGICVGYTHPWVNRDEFEKYRTLGEVKYVNEQMRIAKQFIREHPKEFLYFCYRRFLATWGNHALNARQAWRWIWLPWMYAGLTVTTICGLLWMWYKRKPLTTLIFWILLLYPWPYYLTCVQARFRHLMDPLMLIITVYLFLELAGLLKFKKENTPEAQPAS